MSVVRRWMGVLALAGMTHAQSGEGLLTIGPNGVSGADCTVCVDVPCVGGGPCANLALEAALALLPPGGGEIVFLPGTYSFGKRVTITQDNVRLRASGVTFVAPNAMGLAPDEIGLIDVVGDGFSVQGGTYLEPAPRPGGFLLRVTGVQTRISDAEFRVNGDTSDYVSIELRGLLPGDASSAFDHLGSSITGCDFLFNATNGIGVVGIRAIGGRALRIIGNQFVSAEPSGAPVPIGTALYVEDASHGVIANNVFTGIGENGSPTGPALWVRSTPQPTNNEGHHLSVTGNFFEQCQESMRFDGGKFLAITGNILGRGIRGLRLTSFDADGPSPETQSGSANVVTGNQFHNIGGTDSYALRIEHQLGVTVSGNQFGLANGTQILLGEKSGKVHVTGNSFVAAPGAGCLPQAVLAGPGALSYVVRENTAFAANNSAWERVVFPEDFADEATGRNTFENIVGGRCTTESLIDAELRGPESAREQHP